MDKPAALHATPTRWDPRPHFPALALAVAGVAGMTFLIHAVPSAERIANISMLYLAVVLAAALWLGHGPALLAAVLSFLAFDWFFVQPRQTLTVKDPSEWLALVMFLLTAAITGHLTATARARAREARDRERDTETLAHSSWAVASQPDPRRALEEVLKRVSEAVPVEAEALLVVDPSEGLRLLQSGHPSHQPITTEEEATLFRVARFVVQERQPVGWGEDSRHWEKAVGEPSLAGSIFLPLLVEHRVLGVLHVRPTPGYLPTAGQRRVLESLANHAAVALERERLQGEQTSRQALEEADRLKTALLAMVSHDFRSPLSGIKASVTGLLEEGVPMDPETERELLVGIDRETDRLNRMVGNILTLSRLEADAWRPQVEPTSVTELVGAALGTFSTEENARIRVELPPDTPELLLDPVQITQVLRNLVENALKYSGPGQPVLLSLAGDERSVWITVSDNGPGLPTGEEERVFEPFYRAPALRESATPGVGIGLAVCRGLVEAHHGRITAANRPEGGALFTVSLPRTPGKLPEPPE